MKNKTVTGLLMLLSTFRAQATDPDTAFNNQFRREIGGWIAADATFSIVLPDGRTLWLFGDTFIGEVDPGNAILPGASMIRNSGVIQQGTVLQTLFGGTRDRPQEFIPTAHPDSTWYWPEHGWMEGDTLRIFVARYRHNPEAPAGFQFAYDGNDIACFTYPGLEFIRTVPVRAGLLNGVIYGDRVLEDANYIYIYGRKEDDPGSNIPYPHSARALKGKVMEQEWEFHTAAGWSTDPTESLRINNFPVSQQYSVSTYRGKYILLTQDIWLSPRIWSFTSDSPVGPWETRKLVYTTPETTGEVFTYNAYVHPQFDQDQEMLVSYNVNGDFWSIFSNVEIYRPRFIRVPYMNLDYAFWPNRKVEYSVSGHLEARLFPNPVLRETTLLLEIKTPGILSVDLVDLNGRMLLTLSPRQVQQGEERITLDTGNEAPGIYLLRVRLNQEEVHLPLVKSMNR
jgi:hypothetical protein